MSYSDQHKGTELSGASAGAPQTAAPTPSGRGPPITLLAGIALLIVAVIGAAFVLSSGQPPGSAGASATPTASQRSEALEGFLELARKKEVSYRVRLTSTIRTGGAKVEMRGQGEAAGPNFDGHIVYREGSNEVSFDRIVIDGEAFGRSPGQAWRQLPDEETGSSDPFANLGPDVIFRDLGVEQRGNRSVRHLQARGPEVVDLERLRRISQVDSASVESARFDAWVSSKGVPVEIDEAVTLRGKVDGRTHEVMVTVKYKLSRVARPSTSRRPICNFPAGPSATPPVRRQRGIVGPAPAAQ